MSYEFFTLFWYVIVIASIICYAMLDGFDLGVGLIHLFVKKDQERRIFLNAIGPVWDGNEVWLVIVVGALFAGFPFAYATLLSAFYVPISLLVFSLIFRAVAIEFRSKHPKRWWRSTWDTLFSLGSLFIALLVGMLLGNFIEGIPLDENFEYQGRMVATFMAPYPFLVGILTISLFMMHGAIFLVMKTEDQLQEKIIRWIGRITVFFMMSYAITTMVTLIYKPHMVEAIREKPYLFFVVLGNMVAIASIFNSIHKHRFGWAFIASCANIAFLLALFALGMFPNLIRSSIHPEYSLTLSNAASSLKTLQVLAVIVAIGLPLVFCYGYYIYRIFRGKVQLDHRSY